MYFANKMHTFYFQGIGRSDVTVPSCFFWIRQHYYKCHYGTHFLTITNDTRVPCN